MHAYQLRDEPVVGSRLRSETVRPWCQIHQQRQLGYVCSIVLVTLYHKRALHSIRA